MQFCITFLIIYFISSFHFLEATDFKQDIKFDEDYHISKYQIIPNKKQYKGEKSKLKKPNKMCRFLSFLTFFKKNNGSTDTLFLQELPKEIILNISKYLNSPDIFCLSIVNKSLASTFSNQFWEQYSKSLPHHTSYLLFEYSNLLVQNKKAFIAHIFYCEDFVEYAARLGHPEALMIYEYGPFGASITAECFLSPSGEIKDHLKGTCQAQTQKLQQAKTRKMVHDTEKNEKLRIKSETFLPMY